MSDCRSCRAPIQWVIVAKSGKKMPIDPTPVGDGNIVMLATTDGETGLPLIEYVPAVPLPEQGDRVQFPLIGETTPGTRARYRSHFSTCPNADQHRR